MDVEQGSEAWEQLRAGVPTASNFHRIVTPARAQLASSWKSYAAELIAGEIGILSPAPPSFWMQHGTENEPYAVAVYEKITGANLRKAGFVWPDTHKKYGCSPDRIVNDEGLLEIKCPKPETLLEYHINQSLPNEYKPQVQGQLMITGLPWCDFMGYHPDLAPFILRVERDDEYIASLYESLEAFCENLEKMRDRLVGVDKPVDVQILQDYAPIEYTSVEIDL